MRTLTANCPRCGAEVVMDVVSSRVEVEETVARSMDGRTVTRVHGLTAEVSLRAHHTCTTEEEA